MRVGVALTVTLLGLGTVSTHGAEACGLRFDTRDAILLAGRDPEAVIREAERLVAAGDVEEASRLVAAGIALPALERESPLVDRTLRLLARIVIRTPLAADAPAEARRERDAKLRWAVRVLDLFAGEQLAEPQPLVLGDLGEALAQLPEERAVARDFLEMLAERDLLVTAEAHAALARLRAERGDRAGAALALARCRLMAAHARACEAGAPDAAALAPPA
jgi:hypothetical protein